MRSDSFTRSCPMNSDRRCGRSESSTTLSSGMISGVVISARDMTGQSVTATDAVAREEIIQCCREVCSPRAHPSRRPRYRQRSEVNPRMLDNKVARIEDVPLSEVPYWDWLLYPSAYPRWKPWRK